MKRYITLISIAAAVLAAATSCKDKFKTNAEDVYVNPYVTTLGVDEFSAFGNSYSAILHGRLAYAVDMNELPAEDFGFECGEDPKLTGGFRTVSSEAVEGDDNRGFRAKISDLSQSTTYYYRAFVKVNGNIERGAIASFTTDILHPTSVSLNETDIRLKFGENETFQLTATVNPPAAPNQEVEWKSSNTSVATVSSTGFVTAVGAGYSLITVTTKDGGKEERCSVNIAKQDYQAIDLGLSVKWANINVGAAHEADAGWYFQWGGSTPANNPQGDGYKYKRGGTTPPDKLSGSAQDAACYQMRGSWRMPTSDELDELLNNCVWSKVTVRGVDGYRVIKNGNSIFLPFAGLLYRVDTQFYNSKGYYWASTRAAGPDPNYFEYAMGDCLILTADSKENNKNEGYLGFPIRAVQ